MPIPAAAIPATPTAATLASLPSLLALLAVLSMFGSDALQAWASLVYYLGSDVKVSHQKRLPNRSPSLAII